MSHKVAKRSGWTIGDGEPEPGDTIEFPPALHNSPRGPERYAWSDDYEHYANDEPNLRIEAIERGPPQTPACCGFCSPDGSIAERGVYEPDYRLVAPDGETIVFTCHACVADATVVDGGNDA